MDRLTILSGMAISASLVFHMLNVRQSKPLRKYSQRKYGSGNMLKKTNTSLDHVHFEDMLLGVGIGDAFGAGIEFMSSDWIRDNVKFDCYVNRRTGSWGINYHAGKYTDDCEMTIAMCKALMSEDVRLTENSLVRWFLKEWNEGIRKNGYPRQGHGSIRLALLSCNIK
eukprot:TRINITY_DN3793_c0_g1_i3.p2 TRINITY_DN3793_c0_g1~~TRINITY_DN3793_c0_g1_i3.p2  ORF type:complete len:168 (-),score=22.40 TRINITY_DN3793_c0_g1_i3:721-1224(-)